MWATKKKSCKKLTEAEQGHVTVRALQMCVMYACNDWNFYYTSVVSISNNGFIWSRRIDNFCTIFVVVKKRQDKNSTTLFLGAERVSMPSSY